jgi:hypothetical protein
MRMHTLLSLWVDPGPADRPPPPGPAEGTHRTAPEHRDTDAPPSTPSAHLRSRSAAFRARLRLARARGLTAEEQAAVEDLIEALRRLLGEKRPPRAGDPPGGGSEGTPGDP